MRLHTVQTSFLTGQLSDEAQARSETALYKNGAAEVLNCLPLATGGLLTRWGSTPVLEIPSGPVALHEFTFSAEQSYLCAFLPGLVVFFFAADGVAAGSLAGTPWTGTEVLEVKIAQAGDVMFCTHPNHAPRLIRRTGATTWALEQLSFESPSATPTYRYAPASIQVTAEGGELGIAPGGGGAYIEFSNAAAIDFMEAQKTNYGWRMEVSPGVTRVFTVASSEVVSGTSPENPGNLIWRVVWADGQPGPALGTTGNIHYFDAGVWFTAFFGQPIPGTVKDNATFGAAAATVLFALRFSADFAGQHLVGQPLRVRDEKDNVWRVAVVRGVPDARLAVVTWESSPMPHGRSTYQWEEQAFSATRGWPRSVGIYQQRLVFGGATAAGDAVWMSRSGRFYNFDLGTGRDGDAIAIAVGATRARAIRHVLAADGLMFLTERGTYWIPPDAQRPLSPTTAACRLVAEYGTADVPPNFFDGGALMVSVERTSVRDYAPSDNGAEVRLTSDAVSLAATSFLGRISSAAYMAASDRRPEQYAFFANEAGQIVVFHSSRAQKIGAWSVWTTQGAYKAVGVAGGTLFAAVERGGRVWLERFSPDAWFDHAYRVTAIGSRLDNPGLSYLSGYTVHARAGIDYLGEALVGFGGLIQPTREDIAEGLTCEVGLAFDWRITPLPPAVDLPDGTMLRRTQRTHRTHIRLIGAQACSMGKESFTVLADGFAIGEPPAPRTGWWRATHLGFQRSQNIDGGGSGERVITRSVPVPVGVLALRREVLL